MLNDAAHATVIEWLVKLAGNGAPTTGDCGRGQPENMTPLTLVPCGAAQLANHTRFEMDGGDGTMRLSHCRTHAVAIDCTQAGGMARCGLLEGVAERMILSGVLPTGRKWDEENFHFTLDGKTIVF
eukprot:SAG22_NODE_4464_length_1260_cov_1.811370_2_plen_125_part_01